MARLVVENHKRSSPATFIARFHLSYETSAEQLAKLKSSTVQYLNKHQRQWRPEVAILTDDVSPGPNNMLTISIWVTVSAAQK